MLCSGALSGGPIFGVFTSKKGKMVAGEGLREFFLFPCDSRTGQGVRQDFLTVELEQRAPQKGKSVMYKAAL